MFSLEKAEGETLQSTTSLRQSGEERGSCVSGDQ